MTKQFDAKSSKLLRRVAELLHADDRTVAAMKAFGIATESLGLKDEGEPARYKVIDGSVSAHCCFKATVMDTETTSRAWPDGIILCECFSDAAAEKVAAALEACNEV